MLGIRAAMQLAEQRVYAQAPQALSPERLREMEEAGGRTLFVAGNYPGAEWQQAMGFEPDLKRHYQVTIGIAVDPGPGVSPNLLARAFVSRDPSEDLCHIVWNPRA
jgi:uncharacterized protein YciU (UPF0263 family)